MVGYTTDDFAILIENKPSYVGVGMLYINGQ